MFVFVSSCVCVIVCLVWQSAAQVSTQSKLYTPTIAICAWPRCHCIMWSTAAGQWTVRTVHTRCPVHCLHTAPFVWWWVFSHVIYSHWSVGCQDCLYRAIHLCAGCEWGRMHSVVPGWSYQVYAFHCGCSLGSLVMRAMSIIHVLSVALDCLCVLVCLCLVVHVWLFVRIQTVMHPQGSTAQFSMHTWLCYVWLGAWSASQ